jgi:hypothetical protein
MEIKNMTCQFILRTSPQGVEPLPIQPDAEGGRLLRFRADAGLYQLSAIADGATFNWDSLYFNLHWYGNSGQRTGPWDFNLMNGNTPLVPTYRVTLDGHYIGLWFFQRVSLEDLAAHCFRGRMAFWLRAGGEHELRLVPYDRAADLPWIQATLEPDPEDRLEAIPDCFNGKSAPLAPWGREAFWEEQRRRLEGACAAYRRPLLQMFDWVHSLPAQTLNAEEEAKKLSSQRVGSLGAEHGVMLAASQWLDDRPDGVKKAIIAIETALAAPSFGNPNPDGYSHNGDMNAARAIEGLVEAHHALGPYLDADQRQRLLDKIRRHGAIFLELMLLNRDYWGGSVRQDHGWKSVFCFTHAALNLWGVTDEAAVWLQYLLPRMNRALEAMPRDGVIPTSSYGVPELYLLDVGACRDDLRALGGEDLFERAQFKPICGYLESILRESNATLLTDNGPARLLSGHQFFNRMAQEHDDAAAGRLHRRLMEVAAENFTHPSQRIGSFRSLFTGFFSYDPAHPLHAALPPSQREPRKTFFYPDSGLVVHRDDRADWMLRVHCGPPDGHTAYRNAQGPCDRMSGVPGAGHFLLRVKDELPLSTPTTGYRMHSFLRSILLIDERGQIGDIGYPMSIPSWKWPGEEMESVRMSGEESVARLNLQPGYPSELGLLRYVRELRFGAEGIICRDIVALREPRRLSWLFHSRLPVELDGSKGRYRIGSEQSAVWIEPRTPDEALTASVHETEVVWSYSSADQRPFHHVRYDSAEPRREMIVEFLIRPQAPLSEATSSRD